MNRFYPVVAERAAHRCEYCRAPERLSNISFEVEHTTPTAAGGKGHPGNLALSCRACNQFKSDFLTGIDPETGMEIALFNPRSEVWRTHFGPNINTAEIVGITPTGRATVTRLQMNRPIALAVRRLWIQFGVFP